MEGSVPENTFMALSKIGNYVSVVTLEVVSIAGVGPLFNDHAKIWCNSLTHCPLFCFLI